MAIENDLDIIPVINKIDLPAADVEKVTEEIVNLIGCDPSEIIPISAKTGQNVEAVLEAVIERISSPRVYTSSQPSPLKEKEQEQNDSPLPQGRGAGGDELKALVFDSQYDSYR